jgi:carboxyl-terminal processing protease
MNKKIPVNISIRSAIVLFVLIFILGWFIGNSRYLFVGQDVIRGIDVDTIQQTDDSTDVTGEVNNIDAVPEYLTKDVDFKLFWEAWSLVRGRYYEADVPETQMFYGSLAGMVASLGDPYSVFLTPQGSEEFHDDLDGHFEGIGAEIGIKNNRLTVITPLPGTPAERSGLKPADLILMIDDYDTAGISLNKAVSLIRGEKDSVVNLTIYRDGFAEPTVFEVIRGSINVDSLTWEYLDDGLVHIKVRQFNDDTVPLFQSAIIDLMQRDINGIVLDLRSNPGGYLQSAITMASEWVNGKVVVSEQLRSGEIVEHSANRPPRLDSYETVVLINSGTASGSEIVAGALKDWEEATIVGENSFGKGSVQSLYNLRDGSSIKLTIAKWFTPKGGSIEDGGITPDIEIELTEEDYNANLDPQLDKAIEILK